MDTMFKIKHFAHKTLLTLLGPADLDEHNDPRVILQREYDEHFAHKTPAEVAGAAEAGQVGEVAQTAEIAERTTGETSGAPRMSALPATDQRAVA